MRRSSVLRGSRRGWLIGALAVALVASGLGVSFAGPTGQAADPSLSAQLDSILADPRLDGAQHALTVRDADTGQTLYDTNGSLRLIPASNAKLFSSTAALDVLGPDFRFATDVERNGHVVGPSLQGDLYLKGFGDPTETADDYDALAAKVAASGIHYVTGQVVADDSYFDATRLAPFWSWDDEPYYYSAQTSALNISPDDIGDTGTVLVDVAAAARVGARPLITMIPANHYVQIRDTATTGPAGSASTINAVREYGKNVVDVTGSIPLGGSYASQPTVNEPEILAGQVFAAALARHGVRVANPAVAHAAAPGDAVTVADHSSQPLSQTLTPFLKLSNNMIAEALTKAMGQKVAGQGTWAAGTAAILAAAKADGIDTSTLQLFDGSGLGRADYLTADQTTSLLEAVRAKPWFATWYAALPIAGEPDQLVGGTLRNRLGGTAAAGNLHGKTGSETGVSSLSGYVTDRQGHHLVFSMFSNNFVLGGITHVEDAVALALAEYTGGTAGTAVRVAPNQPADRARAAQLECSWAHAC